LGFLKLAEKVITCIMHFGRIAGNEYEEFKDLLGKVLPAIHTLKLMQVMDSGSLLSSKLRTLPAI
jgi:hypothetical protein